MGDPASRTCEVAPSLGAKPQTARLSRRLRLTDISVPWGGLFDCRENWTPTPGHIWHRHGIDIDVVDGAVAGDGRLVALNHRKLNSLACDTGLKRYEYPKIHYRLEGCVAEPDREE